MKTFRNTYYVQRFCGVWTKYGHKTHRKEEAISILKKASKKARARLICIDDRSERVIEIADKNTLLRVV